MKHRGPVHRKVRRLNATLLMPAAVIGLLFLNQWVAAFEGQGRKPPAKSKPQVESKTGDAVFRHESHRPPKAKLNCSDCHTIPSPATPDFIAAATKPSIKGYPYHDSCLPCHRLTPPQFFRGTNPIICTVCHTRSSPRLSARDVR